MAEGLEYVSRMIVQCAEFEKQTLGAGALRKIISDMVTKLYVEILKYLANAWRHYNQRTSGTLTMEVEVKSTTKLWYRKGGKIDLPQFKKNDSGYYRSNIGQSRRDLQVGEYG